MNRLTRNCQTISGLLPPCLLLAATKISDLYMLLANEAYADAQDPTIGFGTDSGQYGSLASSIFAFDRLWIW